MPTPKAKAGRNRAALILLTVIVVLFSIARAPSVSAASLSPQEALGKQLYFKGMSVVGAPLSAEFGREKIRLTGMGVACVNCHGYDGLGRSESGLTGPDITWGVLMKSYGHLHANGFEHPRFTEESLKSYLVTGVYPGGKKGDPAMPVYSMSGADLDALIAYLRKIDSDLGPGVSDTAIRVGTIIPGTGNAGEMGEVMRNTIASSLADINARGGIYGRKLELVVERTEKAPTREKLKAWLDRQEPFALVGSFTPGMDREMASLVEEGNLPLIGPFTFLPLDSVSLNRHVFYIFSGLREQVKALAGFARGKVDSGDVRVALLYPARKELAETVDAAEEAFRNKGFGNVQRNKFPVGGFAAETLVRNLRQQGVGLVLFLGDDGEIEAFVKEADRQNWVPRILMPGVLIGKGLQNVSPRFRQNLFLAYPTLPEDRKDWGMMELSSVLGMQSLSSTHLSAQLSAYAAVKVLVEGLRRSGRELRQEKFLASLENLTDLDTGLTPLLSYDRNRRIGALGAYIVTIDPREKSFFTSKEWVVGY